MDITIYLPDDIAARAKKQNVNLSRMLRDALTAQFEEEDTVAKTLEDVKEIVLDLEDDNGHSYKGRITGTKIGDSGDVEVFLTDEQNVLVYDGSQLKYWVCADPEENLRDWLTDNDQYIEAMDALGISATVDLQV